MTAPARAASNEWRGIETAPKDSKSRLVWNPSNQCTYCVSWGTYWIAGKEFQGWLIFGGGYRETIEPTHWHPLPEPPHE